MAIVEKLFPNGLPALGKYAEGAGVSPSTFRRAGGWLLGLLPELLESRRPGPAKEEPAGGPSEREEALGRLEDLRAWLSEQCASTEKNRCLSPEAKLRIAQVSEEVRGAGILSFQEIAQTLGIDERILRRIRKQVAKSGGEAPRPRSRRPQHCPAELSEEIQKLIGRIERSADTRRPYGPTDVKRILEKKYKKELLEHHGQEEIALTTVAKYLGRKEAEATEEHPRGSYVYPEPFEAVAIDTSYFKVFGLTFYLITVLELGGRLNLITRVFLREDTTAVLEVLEEYLAKYPGVGVAVIDRGTPYLNDTVKALLEENGRFRLVCPPATPTAKAAAERHFGTLKQVLHPALEKVFPRDPGWEAERLAKLLEMGAAVFQELYHRIPQEGIDGKSPLERAAELDPVRASARMAELFDDSINSEPSEETARELHRRFQLPGSEEETIRTLRRFSTRTLRETAEKLAPHLGPPAAKWIYDARGYLAATAQEISRKHREVSLAAKYRDEEAKHRREREREHQEALEAEEREMEEHPERFVDRALRSLGLCFKNDWSIERCSRDLRKILADLARHLKSAFSYELDRLKAGIPSLVEDPRARQALERFLDDFFTQWRLGRACQRE